MSHSCKTATTISLSFRCPGKLHRRMQQHAAALHMDLSEFIHTALEFSLGPSAALNEALASIIPPTTSPS